MRFAGNDPASAFPDPAVPVVEWPIGGPAPSLPDGCGGIAVHTWYASRWDRQHPELPRNVGIDDHPLWHGWGRMVAVVPAGEHLVEVRRTHVEGSRLVSVRPGELVELEYVGPRNWGTHGALTEPPAREVGSTSAPWLLAIGAFVVLSTVLARMDSDGVLKHSTAMTAMYVVIALGVVGPLLWVRRNQRRDARYRIETADLPRRVTDGISNESGHLLGPQPKFVPAPDAGSGGLLVTATLSHDLRLGGIPYREAGESVAWLARPRLRIDGRQYPICWSAWSYSLSPGRHEVEFCLPEPSVAPEAAAHAEPGIAPVSLTVEIAEGATRQLRIEAKTRTDVRPKWILHDEGRVIDVRARLSSRHSPAPVEAVRFTSTVTSTLD